jgi:hypothetical protein
MKKFLTGFGLVGALVLGWVLTRALVGFSAESDSVTFVGGTISSLKSGEPGKFDTKSPTDLIFENTSSRFAIPFARIDSYEHSQEVAHHLGVVPAIAIGLLKKRQGKHFLRIAFHDDGNTAQVLVFEVPKKMPRVLLAILQQRAPQGCKPQGYERCKPQGDI